MWMRCEEERHWTTMWRHLSPPPLLLLLLLMMMMMTGSAVASVDQHSVGKCSCSHVGLCLSHAAGEAGIVLACSVRVLTCVCVRTKLKNYWTKIDVTLASSEYVL